MAGNSKIEWTESTWNPVTGCDKVSQGCKHCYAETMAKRLYAMGNPRYRNGFSVTLHEDLIELPLRWKKPRTIFVNSMSDLFHKDVPDAFIKAVFDTMRRAYWHNFQILTKRSARLLELSNILEWYPNIWIGVSVEDRKSLYRIDHLRTVSASVRFLSVEPLLESLGAINLSGISWVIVGGESGPHARPMSPSWVRDLRDQCTRAGVPFFFKQWGGVQKKKTGRHLDGRTWDQMPNKHAVVA